MQNWSSGERLTRTQVDAPDEPPLDDFEPDVPPVLENPDEPRLDESDADEPPLLEDPDEPPVDEEPDALLVEAPPVDELLAPITLPPHATTKVARLNAAKERTKVFMAPAAV